MNTTEMQSVPWQVRGLSVFLLMWKFTFNVSDAGMSALLSFLCSYLNLLSVTCGGAFKIMADHFPRTLKSAFKLILILLNLLCCVSMLQFHLLL